MPRVGTSARLRYHGILDRELRQVRAKVIPNTKREVLQNAILDNVTPFAKVYTDEAAAYMGLEKKFVHKVIDHRASMSKGRCTRKGLRISGRCLRGRCAAPTLPWNHSTLTNT